MPKGPTLHLPEHLPEVMLGISCNLPSVRVSYASGNSVFSIPPRLAGQIIMRFVPLQRMTGKAKRESVGGVFSLDLSFALRCRLSVAGFVDLSALTVPGGRVVRYRVSEGRTLQ